MNNKILPVAILLLAPLSSYANPSGLYVTPMIGYTFSGTMKTDDGKKLDVKNAENYSLAIETDLEPGRIGMFLSHQRTDTQDINGNTDFTYLHFQSSLRFKPTDHLGSYFGASIGGTFIGANWSDKDLLFSAGLFGGLEYEMTDYAKIVLEGRWLANMVKSNTTTICTLPSGNETCKISIDSEILNQFQTNIGLQFSF
ncbi:hypothetical protein A3K86_01980 [Photobacterium jeanii]|uniref:Outer membrane protein beta-barrel domain-containing protein n=1 Tax=Photobacterium jeanii TaxID=858640 RepID=A0A178KMC4_9GAMM|nr:hypothetical protein [Photobacterium jeanii]OAN17712.1 hypothetical protein A3K86_01980 [Photobacterium jeanii]PST92628.1 hypothetical protein C9I91_05500 [Photobacterium jeanii]